MTSSPLWTDKTSLGLSRAGVAALDSSGTDEMASSSSGTGEAAWSSSGTVKVTPGSTGTGGVVSSSFGRGQSALRSPRKGEARNGQDVGLVQTDTSDVGWWKQRGQGDSPL